MNREYKTEREGQIEFFKNYGIPYESDEILVDNTDGVYNGCIFEFKLTINNPNATLYQALKYLSKMRIKGRNVPATIILVSLNNSTAYVFKSENYRKYIQRTYVGEASKNNEGFDGGKPVKTLHYDDMADSLELKNLITKEKDQMFMAVDLDEECIVGWAERYYRENPDANKGDFLGDEDGTSVKITGEIREPKYFKGLIRPYQDKTNVKFKYLMDKLNDTIKKKKLGAFYTPEKYAKKAAELVKMAINNVPEGNDYIILDRCAGTGSLEEAIINALGDEVASHCICSTYEYYEYKVLLERVGDKVRAVLPPTEADVVYQNGCIINADAMSKEFVENPIIKKYVDDEKCTVIMFENPPYRDESSGMSNGVAIRTGKSKDFVTTEMKKEIAGVASNDLSNRFVWSAFKYYMRDEHDAYIVFCPIKYWKQYDLFDAYPEKGFLFNRKHFHATESGISCVLWKNVPGNGVSEIGMEAFDIADGEIKKVSDVNVKKVKDTVSKLYEKVNFSDDDEKELYCEKSGYEISGRTCSLRSYMNDDVIGYMNAHSFQISPLTRNITRFPLYDGHGCFLTKENFFRLLPCWCSKHVPLDNWYQKDVYATTADGGKKYQTDSDFLKSCMLYTGLSNQNKNVSMTGSDGETYLNELCFDNGTLMSLKLEEFDLDEEEKELMECWRKVYESAKATGKLKDGWKYGVYQISKEINTFKKKQDGRKTTIVYDYPELNGNLETLRVKLKKYYTSHIVKKMFDYELLK